MQEESYFSPRFEEWLSSFVLDIQDAREKGRSVVLVEDRAHRETVSRALGVESTRCWVVKNRKNVDLLLMEVRRQGVNARGLVDHDGVGKRNIDNEDLIYVTDYWDVESSLMMTDCFTKVLQSFDPRSTIDQSKTHQALVDAASIIGTYRKAALDSRYGFKFQELPWDEIVRLRSQSEFCATLEVDEERLKELATPANGSNSARIEFRTKLAEYQNERKTRPESRKKFCHGKDMIYILERIFKWNGISVSFHGLKENLTSCAHKGLVGQLVFLTELSDFLN